MTLAMDSLSERARRLHAEAIVFDGHCDTLLGVLSGECTWSGCESGHVDLPRMQAGGVTAQIFAAFVRPDHRHAAAKETLRIFETLYELLDAGQDTLLLSRCAADVRRAKAEGKLAAIMSMEGAEGFEDDLLLLRAFHRLGVRNIGLTWNHRNLVADGAGEIGAGGGLTEFGVRAVQEMRKLGIMLDISHLAPAGVDHVFRVYEGPVVASHSNATSVWKRYGSQDKPDAWGVRRGLTDAQIDRVAASGGVIGVTFVPVFITEKEEDACLERLIDHIDHIVHVAGIDHVGLGSDWDGFHTGPCPDFPRHSGEMPLITEALVRRGYSDADILKVLGGNWLRVFEQVAG